VSRFTSETTGWAVVAAYDPGGTSGWSVMCLDPVALLGKRSNGDRSHIKAMKTVPQSLKHFAAGEITGPRPEQCDQLAELIDVWADCAVVGEGFTLRKFSMDDVMLEPIRINACIEWHLYGSGRPLFTQTPEQAKSKWNDDRLKRAKSLGQPWWVVGKEHARDGVRHAGLFLDRCRQQPELRGRAWPHLFNLKGELK
jgi:hypothetical protein